jgi:hypothetical protein
MCGNIINWMIYAENTRSEKREDGLEESSMSTTDPADSAPPLGLQVWRPVLPLTNDSTGTGCYSLVDSQGVSAIPINDDAQQLTLGPTSPAYDMPFQPGDVLGFYVNISDNDDYDGIEIQHVPNITVWYAGTSTMDTVFIGNNPPGHLHYSSRVAPAISIAIGKQSHNLLY